MAASELGAPTVVVDDLRIHYRIGGSGRGGRYRLLGRPRAGTPAVVRAVDGVSFIARKGESIGVIGKNGSGKSTLLRAIAGYMPPTSGAVFTVGSARLLGVNAALLPELSGRQNVQLGALAQGMSSRDVAEQFDEIAAFADIGSALDRPMRTYSSGMGARLRFAIATASTPDVLLIDEALGTGDTEFRDRSEERIREVRDRAGTIFFVSHTLGAIEQTCGRTIWLDDGIVRVDGPTEEVVRAYRRYYALRKDFREGRVHESPVMPGPLLAPHVPESLVPRARRPEPPRGGPRHAR